MGNPWCGEYRNLRWRLSYDGISNIKETRTFSLKYGIKKQTLLVTKCWLNFVGYTICGHMIMAILVWLIIFVNCERMPDASDIDSKSMLNKISPLSSFVDMWGMLQQIIINMIKSAVMVLVFHGTLYFNYSIYKGTTTGTKFKMGVIKWMLQQR